MKGLESGKDKIQKICDVLKKETLEPAKQEAREIVENAHLQASEIVKEAEKKAEAIIQEAMKEMEEKRKLFQSSLQLACRQGIELLKQKIEEQLLDHELTETVVQEMKDPQVIANILAALLKNVEEKGIDDELIGVIPKQIPPRAINALLVSKDLERLKNKTVTIGDFEGGIQLQFKDRKITLDISDRAVRELIALYIRRDFRDMIFSI